MTYSEKLKDPRWQKKRLEVLEHYGWKCRDCGSKEKTLHVHHKFYIRKFQPWEYPPVSFAVLCEECHASAEIVKRNLLQYFGSFPTAHVREMLGEMYRRIANDLPLTPPQQIAAIFRLLDGFESDGEVVDLLLNHRKSNYSRSDEFEAELREAGAI